MTVHDPAADSDDEIAETVAFANVLEDELFPGEPPTPVAQAIADVRARPERMRQWSVRARDGKGNLAGMAETGIDPAHDENPDLLEVSVRVLPDHRRRGVGSALLAELFDRARREGRTRLLADTNERVPAGEAFAQALAATPKLAVHLNHLPTAEVDRPTMQQWVADGPRRAPGYELIGFDGACPDELLEAYADLINVMNTAPRDDLEIEDFVATPERNREFERRSEAMGYEQWVLIARHRASGDLVGYHTVGWNPANPTAIWIGDTGVQPAHRGHALGKWLKAVMTLRILDERPDVVDIRTGNADSNDAMLGINRAMGYRPMIGRMVWELTVADGAKRLASRGGSGGVTGRSGSGGHGGSGPA